MSPAPRAGRGMATAGWALAVLVVAGACGVTTEDEPVRLDRSSVGPAPTPTVSVLPDPPTTAPATPQAPTPVVPASRTPEPDSPASTVGSASDTGAEAP